MEIFKKIQLVLGKGNALKFSGVFFLLLTVAIFEAFGIGAIFPLLAAVSDPSLIDSSKLGRFFISYLDVPSGSALLPYISALVLFLFVSKNAILLLTTYIQAKIIHQQRAGLSALMFEHYMNISYDLFIQRKIAEMIHNSSGIVNQFVLTYCISLLKIVAESFIVIAIFSLLLLINFKIAIGVLVVSIIMGLIYTQLTRKYLVRLGKEGQENTVGFYQVIHEGLGGVKEVKVLKAESFFMDLFNNFIDKYKKIMIIVSVMQVAPKVMIETIIIVMVTGFIFYSYWADQNVIKILPVLGVFGVAFMRLYPSFHSILSSISLISSNRVSLDVLYEELKDSNIREAEVCMYPEEKVLSFQHSLELKKLYYRYPGTPKYALEDINLTISRGESIAFVGKSGAGKTTLVDALLGLLNCEHGNILLDGFDMLQEPSKWHRMLGYIPQHIFLMNDTIQQNIAFGIPVEDIDIEAMNKALESSQLQDFVDHLPDGKMTIVGDRGVRLSGGQRQRIGIARALYRNPEILILDEATSALDNETEASISKAIEKISQEKTLIIIAHRLSTVKNCDHLYLLDEGKIIEQGSYSELLRKNEWFRKVNDLASTN